MKRVFVTWMALTALVALLSACAPAAGTYPISGEECGPDDPVKTLDASDCIPQ